MQRGILSREIENIKSPGGNSETKRYLKFLKMEIFISLIGMTVKTISELKERLVEIIQSAEERKWI